MESYFVDYLIVAAVMTLGSVVQCAVGFASGLVVAPILLMAGWTLPEAITINLIAGTVQNVSGAVHLRHAFDWATGLRPNLIRLACVPIGVATLYAVQETLDPNVIKQIVGGLILIFVLLLATGRIRPRADLNVGWEWLAMGSAGFLLGFCGMGGPAIVMWVTAQGWPGDKARAFMFHAFSISILPMAALLLGTFGKPVLVAGGVALLVVPFAFLGARLGLRLGAAMPDQLLRRITIALLVAIAATAIIGP
jgi:hypothetical protein